KINFRYLVQISNDFLKTMIRGTCKPYEGNQVVCLSEDVPIKDDPEILVEVDREDNNVLLRHIILDDEENPLYVEHFIDRDFLNVLERTNRVIILFVNERGEVLKRIAVTLTSEDVQTLRREMRLGIE
ncbi:MAG: hypothetical protein QXD27_08775, partial [Metallosphaera sp.]